MNNTAPEIISLPETQPSPDASPRSRSGHTRTGKIARLPKTIRDQIDQMLEDGATVDQIKDTLGDAVKDITPNSFSEWKKGGHQDWLKDQFWRQEMCLRQEAFTEILQGADPVRLPEAGLQLTATAICELLREMCDTDGDDQRTRVEKHVRIANALSRLSRSIIQLQQFRNDCARDRAAELKQRNINEDLSDNELEILTAHMDQVFRRPRKKPATESPQQRTVGVSPASKEGVPPANSSSGSDTPVGSPSPSPAAMEVSSSNQSSCDARVPVPFVASEPAPRSSAPQPANCNLQPETTSVEHCLECGSALPPILPNGARPRQCCDQCGFELPPPGSCAEPGTEQCHNCHANLPRLRPNGQRPLDYCHHCTTPLFAPSPPTLIL